MTIFRTKNPHSPDKLSYWFKEWICVNFGCKSDNAGFSIVHPYCVRCGRVPKEFQKDNTQWKKI
jgi:hypothetical protein